MKTIVALWNRLFPGLNNDPEKSGSIYKEGKPVKTIIFLLENIFHAELKEKGTLTADQMAVRAAMETIVRGVDSSTFRCHDDDESILLSIQLDAGIPKDMYFGMVALKRHVSDMIFHYHNEPFKMVLVRTRDNSVIWAKEVLVRDIHFLHIPAVGDFGKEYRISIHLSGVTTSDADTAVIQKLFEKSSKNFATQGATNA
jgi:hypothetical protein